MRRRLAPCYIFEETWWHEQTQETMALRMILALGTRQIREGKVQLAEDVIKRLRERRETRL